MKIQRSVIVVIAFLWISVSSCGQKQKDKAGSQESDSAISLISPSELNKVNKDILLIDVRTPEEFASGHIENSVNIDIKSDDFFSQIDKLDRNQEVYVYCKIGGRSGHAAKKMEEMGFKKIYDLDGGIRQWERDGFKQTK